MLGIKALDRMYHDPDIAFLAIYTIYHTYGSIHLDGLTHVPKDGLPHTTKLRSDFAGTFATAVFPRWTEA